MIVPMKKVSLLLLDSEKNEALIKLKNLGVVHLNDINGSSEKLSVLQFEKDILFRSISFLSDANDKSSKRVEYSKEETLEISKRIISLNEDLKSISEIMTNARKEIDRIKIWGNFDPSDIEKLGKAGVNLKLYELKKTEYKELSDKLTIFNVANLKAIGYYAIISDNFEELQHVDEFQIPETGLEDLHSLLEEKSSLKVKIEQEIETLAYSKRALVDLLADYNDEIEFESVHAGLAVEGQIAYLQGFVPFDKCNQLKKEATTNSWAIMLQEVEESDKIPTLVHNSRAVRIIQPVFDLFGIIPGYHERDISLFFLIFLTIFFALIVGDGGYGLVYFSIAAYFGLRAKKKSGKFPDFAILIVIMGSLTIVWGAITDTWFGSKTLSELPFFKMFTIEALANFTTNDTSSLIMYICFILGVIHISIAHIWNFIALLKKGSVLKSLAQIGWLSIVIGLYFYVLNFVLNPTKFPVPNFALYMILGGVVFLLVFSEQDGKFFKGILKGFSNIITIFFGTVGAFADIISYIRLFAVGLATLAVAPSFNGMATNAGHGVVGIIGAVVILALGHGLNFAMSTLAIVVHGVRLNVLEFSGHLGMEWSGVYYNPFRNKKKDKEGET